VVTPLLLASTACGKGDQAASDSAGGTVAMGDSAAGATTGSMNSAPNNTGMVDAPVAQLLAMANRNEISAGELASTKARNADVKSYAQQMVTEHQQAMQTLTTMSSTAGWSIDSASMMSGMSGGGTGTGSAGSATGTSATGAGTGAGTGSAATGTGTGTSAAGGAGTTAGTTGGATGAGGTGVSQPLMSVMMQMQQTNSQTMQTLRGQSGAAFDRSYMDAQLAAHQQLLDVLRQYSNQVQNNDLRSHVSQIQSSVEQHLNKAKEIRDKLGS
jgi:predicted outer membrane protein